MTIEQMLKNLHDMAELHTVPAAKPARKLKK